MVVLGTAAILALASQYADWDANVVVWLALDAGTGNGESSGRTDALNPAGPYRGLLQIADFNARRFGFDPVEMYDPAKNIDVAHRLWLERGFAPWPAAAKYPGRQAMQFPPDETAPVGSWLKGPRPQGCTPKLIIVHATRGANTQAKQYAATKSWFASTNNGSAAQGWGGCATIVISNEGQKCTFMDELREIPRYSAGYGSFSEPNGWLADNWALSMELAQSASLEDFDPRTIERAALQAATWCQRYGIEPVHLGPTSQRGAAPPRTGIVGHDDLENGTKLGKTDPGSKFPWPQFIARVRDLMGTPQEDNDMITRHNAVAALQTQQVRRDAPLRVNVADFTPAFPSTPRVVRVEVYSTQDQAEPELKVHDSDGAYAGQLGWGRGDPDAYGGNIDVIVRDGFFELRGDARVLLVGAVGYFS